VKTLPGTAVARFEAQSVRGAACVMR